MDTKTYGQVASRLHLQKLQWSIDHLAEAGPCTSPLNIQ